MNTDPFKIDPASVLKSLSNFFDGIIIFGHKITAFSIGAHVSPSFGLGTYQVQQSLIYVMYAYSFSSGVSTTFKVDSTEVSVGGILGFGIRSGFVLGLRFTPVGKADQRINETKEALEKSISGYSIGGYSKYLKGWLSLKPSLPTINVDESLIMDPINGEGWVVCGFDPISINLKKGETYITFGSTINISNPGGFKPKPSGIEYIFETLPQAKSQLQFVSCMPHSYGGNSTPIFKFKHDEKFKFGYLGDNYSIVFSSLISFWIDVWNYCLFTFDLRSFSDSGRASFKASPLPPKSCESAAKALDAIVKGMGKSEKKDIIIEIPNKKLIFKNSVSSENFNQLSPFEYLYLLLKLEIISFENFNPVRTCLNYESSPPAWIAAMKKFKEGNYWDAIGIGNKSFSAKNVEHWERVFFENTNAIIVSKRDVGK